MKKLVLAATLAVLVFSLSACAAKSDPAKTTDAPATTTTAPATTDAKPADTTPAAADTTATPAPADTAAAMPTYKDGTYTKEETDFDPKSGWKSKITITVAGGKITTVDWNESSAKVPDRKQSSKDGKDGMKAAGSVGEWHEEAAAFEAKLIEVQDPKLIAVKDDGKTDAVSGCTITVNGILKLADEALADAK